MLKAKEFVSIFMDRVSFIVFLFKILLSDYGSSRTRGLFKFNFKKKN